jgi:hypothetical protein
MPTGPNPHEPFIHDPLKAAESNITATQERTSSEVAARSADLDEIARADDLSRLVIFSTLLAGGLILLLFFALLLAFTVNDETDLATLGVLLMLAGALLTLPDVTARLALRWPFLLSGGLAYVVYVALAARNDILAPSSTTTVLSIVMGMTLVVAVSSLLVRSEGVRRCLVIRPGTLIDRVERPVERLLDGIWQRLRKRRHGKELAGSLAQLEQLPRRDLSARQFRKQRKAMSRVLTEVYRSGEKRLTLEQERDRQTLARWHAEDISRASATARQVMGLIVPFGIFLLFAGTLMQVRALTHWDTKPPHFKCHPVAASEGSSGSLICEP